MRRCGCASLDELEHGVPDLVERLAPSGVDATCATRMEHRWRVCWAVLWILLPRGFPSRWLGLVLMLPMFFNAPEAPVQNSLRLTIFDVGQGLAVAVQTQRHALLYDTGPDFSNENDSGNRILIPALRAMDIAKTGWPDTHAR